MHGDLITHQSLGPFGKPLLKRKIYGAEISFNQVTKKKKKKSSP